LELKVTKIITYRREVTELPTGMSGELFLQGDGADQLRRRALLVD